MGQKGEHTGEILNSPQMFQGAQNISFSDKFDK